MSIMEKLGLARVRKLNKRICRERVKHILKELKAGRYKGEMKKYAEYYAAWYAWMERNGGTRAKTKRSA